MVKGGAAMSIIGPAELGVNTWRSLGDSGYFLPPGATLGALLRAQKMGAAGGLGDPACGAGAAGPLVVSAYEKHLAFLLGINTGFSSAGLSELISGFRRRQRVYELQALAVSVTGDRRVARCCREPIKGGDTVAIWKASNGRTYYQGVQKCGRLWVCPVCGSVISERRRLDIGRAVTSWAELGGKVVMVTLTVQHGAEIGLGSLYDGLQRAFERLTSGRGWMALRARYGLAHSIRALEVTYGDNGWHPHLHVLYFLTPGQELHVAELEVDMLARWSLMVRAAGLNPVNEHGVNVRVGWNRVADYLEKYGRLPASGSDWSPAHELAKSAVKNAHTVSGRTPFALLADWANGDELAGARFLEYSGVMFGKRHLYWSAGLREAVGLGDELNDEEEIAASEREGEQLVQLRGSEYRTLVESGLLAEGLLAATAGGVEGLRNLLDGQYWPEIAS